MIVFKSKEFQTFTRSLSYSKFGIACVVIFFVLTMLVNQTVSAAQVGIPFIEDFDQDNLKDQSKTTIDWNTNVSALRLNTPTARNPEPVSYFTEIRIGSSVYPCRNTGRDVDSADVNGDGWTDILVGHIDTSLTDCAKGSRLYLSDDFGLFTRSTAISTTFDPQDNIEVRRSYLRDFTGDGNIDVLIANGFPSSEDHSLYVHDGSDDPFPASATITNEQAVGEVHRTNDLVVGDFNGDGRVDFIDGAYNFPVFGGSQRQLFLNNGTATPFSGVSPIPIDTAGNSDSWRMAVADMDGDGDLDLVENSSSTRDGLFLYLNNGSATPFDGVQGIEIGPDLGFINYSLKLADVNGDSHVDIVTQQFVQINNGTANPFDNSTRHALSNDCDGEAIHLVDFNGNGALDLLSEGRVCFNNGTDNPFGGVKSQFYTTGVFDQNPILNNTMLVEDFDFDGELEVFATVTNFGGSDRFLRSYKTPNVYAVSTQFSALARPSNDTTSKAVADFDGNGKVDFITGESRLSTFIQASNGPTQNLNTANTFHANNGDAFFTKTSVGSSDRATVALTAADFDNDGDIDLVEGNYTLLAAQTNRIFFNDGDATPFSEAPIDLGSATETISLASADIDHDGDVDLIEVVKDTGIFVFVNNGTTDPFNGVSPIALYSGNFDQPKNIVFGDINRDGRIDMATANLIFLNNGTSTPFSAAPMEFTGSRARIARLADLNGDGWLDWYRGFINSQAVSNGQDMVHYHTQNSATPYDLSDMESLTTPGLADFIIGDTQDAKIRDFNYDGKLDIYGLTSTGGLLWINNGSPTRPFAGVDAQEFEAPVYDNGQGGQVVDYATVVSAQDYDYDGKVDALHGSRSTIAGDYNPDLFGLSLALRSLAQTTTNSTASFEELNITGNAAKVMLADINADGAKDYIQITRSGDLDWKLNNLSATPFSSPSSRSIQTQTDGLDLVLEDFNHDGHLDAAVAGGASASVIFWGQSSNGPIPYQPLVKSELEIGARALAAGDFNQDGRIDLVESSSGANRVYLNDGTSDPYSLANSYLMTSTETTNALAVGDVNGDGKLDIVEGSFIDELKVFINNGGATPFSGVAATDLGTPQNVNSIALADVDNDGDLDIVDGGNYLTRLFRNNGTATPFNGVSAVNVGTEITDTYQVALIDFDHNGWLDLVEANLDADNTLFLNNRTSNSFSGMVPVPFFDDEQLSTSVSAADVNRDGSLDVVFAKSGKLPRLYATSRDLKFDTSIKAARSIEVDDQVVPIGEIMLASDTTYADLSANSRVDFFLSNDDGNRWYKVPERQRFTFPLDNNQLRWKAEIHSLSPVLSPHIHSVSIGGDSDSDGLFDPIDPDDDNDGVSDAAEIAAGLNPLVMDSDNNGVNDGDEDLDQDGLSNSEESELGTNLIEGDTDGDQVGDMEDAFPLDFSESVDTDGDGVGDNSDPDIDEDGVLNGSDNCPFDMNADQKDSNNNGVGNACDPSSCEFFLIGSSALVCL